MKRWVRGLVPGVKVWLVVLVGLYLAGSASFAAVPVLTTSTLPVICTDVVGSQVTFVASGSRYFAIAGSRASPSLDSVSMTSLPMSSPACCLAIRT